MGKSGVNHTSMGVSRLLMMTVAMMTMMVMVMAAVTMTTTLRLQV